MQALPSSLGAPELEQQLAEARQSLVDVNERVMAFVKQYPVGCVLGAITFGFIVGRIAARA